ncbi:MAG: VOC family protein [Gammaproteobacteria bacterium]|nr:VOC family protein [Gammaproteobacteria bacterium]
MSKRYLGAIVIDCQVEDLDEAAAFWGEVLGHEARRYPDPEDANYRHLTTSPGEPLILLQKVDHPSRVHLDIDAEDVESEVSRLIELGAREHVRVRDFVIMEAPTGHRFCVVPIGSDQNIANRCDD